LKKHEALSELLAELTRSHRGFRKDTNTFGATATLELRNMNDDPISLRIGTKDPRFRFGDSAWMSPVIPFPLRRGITVGDGPIRRNDLVFRPDQIGQLVQVYQLSDDNLSKIAEAILNHGKKFNPETILKAHRVQLLSTDAVLDYFTTADLTPKQKKTLEKELFLSDPETILKAHRVQLLSTDAVLDYFMTADLTPEQKESLGKELFLSDTFAPTKDKLLSAINDGILPDNRCIVYGGHDENEYTQYDREKLNNAYNILDSTQKNLVSNWEDVLKNQQARLRSLDRLDQLVHDLKLAGADDIVGALRTRVEGLFPDQNNWVGEKSLGEHLRGVQQQLVDLMLVYADGKYTSRYPDLLSDREAKLLAFGVAPIHDLLKVFEARELPQALSSHDLHVRRLVQETFLGKRLEIKDQNGATIERLVLSQEDVDFIAEVVGDHENINREQGRNMLIKSSTSSDRAKAIFFVADVLTGTIEQKAEGEYSFNLDQLWKRFGDLYVRHMDPVVGKIFRPEWMVYTIKDLTETLNALNIDTAKHTGFRVQEIFARTALVAIEATLLLNANRLSTGKKLTETQIGEIKKAREELKKYLDDGQDNNINGDKFSAIIYTEALAGILAGYERYKLPETACEPLIEKLLSLPQVEANGVDNIKQRQQAIQSLLESIARYPSPSIEELSQAVVKSILNQFPSINSLPKMQLHNISYGSKEIAALLKAVAHVMNADPGLMHREETAAFIPVSADPNLGTKEVIDMVKAEIGDYDGMVIVSMGANYASLDAGYYDKLQRAINSLVLNRNRIATQLGTTNTELGSRTFNAIIEAKGRVVGVIPTGTAIVPGFRQSNRNAEYPSTAMPATVTLAVDVEDYGDETPWFTEIAQRLAQGKSLDVVMVNGGPIALKEMTQLFRMANNATKKNEYSSEFTLLKDAGRGSQLLSLMISDASINQTMSDDEIILELKHRINSLGEITIKTSLLRELDKLHIPQNLLSAYRACMEFIQAGGTVKAMTVDELANNSNA
jgi:hypothetical protein